MVSTEVEKAVSILATGEQQYSTIQCDGVGHKGQWGRRRDEGGEEGKSVGGLVQ